MSMRHRPTWGRKRIGRWIQHELRSNKTWSENPKKKGDRIHELKVGITSYFLRQMKKQLVLPTTVWCFYNNINKICLSIYVDLACSHIHSQVSHGLYSVLYHTHVVPLLHVLMSVINHLLTIEDPLKDDCLLSATSGTFFFSFVSYP